MRRRKQRMACRFGKPGCRFRDCGSCNFRQFFEDEQTIGWILEAFVPLNVRAVQGLEMLGIGKDPSTSDPSSNGCQANKVKVS